jgi:hypothetical protein
VNILELLGHGVKVASKDVAKVIEIAAKDTGKAVVHAAPFVEQIAAPLLPMVPVVGPALSVALTGELHGKFVPASLPVARSMAGFFQTSIQGDKMNQLESFAITMVLGILQTVVKNPAHKAALETQLIGVADLIYTTYGLAAPTPSPAIPGQVHGV